MEQIYKNLMSERGYTQLVSDIFPNWEPINDESLLQDYKSGSGHGTIHFFLGAGDRDFRKEFAAYYSDVAQGVDPEKGAVSIKNYFIKSNIISMIGNFCQYKYKKGEDFSERVKLIFDFLRDNRGEDSKMLTANSYFKLSKDNQRPYLKKFDKKSLFTEVVRYLLIPNSSYKISLFKNANGDYATLWLIGFDCESDFEANSSTDLFRLSNKDNKQKSNNLQIIYYGAPGTGKSFGIKREVGTKDNTNDGPIREDNNIRTTFHPDSDYASFVGCYKPMRDEENKEKIVYEYVPQAFIKAYIKAWKLRLGGKEDQQFYLIIEEINRGNCAQIFGDMFQLLDREDNGFSSYKVSTDTDLQIYLEEAFKDDDFSGEDDGTKLQQGKLMQLPPNLSILATMNTSDQSLFPMDSAFKRRWNWEYVKIDTNLVKEIYFKVGDGKYSWADFLEVINDYIKEKNESTAKQIGPWFAKPDVEIVDNKPTVISYDNFCSKVLYYLFNDALRDISDFNSLFNTDDDDETKTFFFENLFEKKDKGVANVKKFIYNLQEDRKMKIDRKTEEPTEAEQNNDENQNDEGIKEE